MEWLKADLHLHTNEDYYDHMPHSAYELIDHCAEQGFQVIAITNHCHFTFSETWRDYAQRRGILLIPGVEASIKRSHVLILNADREVNKLRTFEDLKAYRAATDSFIIAPHPFYPALISLRSRLYKHIELFDGIEYHAFYTIFFNPNERARQFATEYHKTLVGNTDGHRLNQIGKTYTRIKAELTLPAVLKALRSGAVEIVTRPLGATEALKSYLDMQFPTVTMAWEKFTAPRSYSKDQIEPAVETAKPINLG